MSPRRTTPPEPTTEQLHMAYRILRNHTWPDTLEAAMERPSYATAIRGRARSLHRANVCTPSPRPALPQGPVPPTPTAPRQVPKAAVRGGSVMHTTPIAFWGHARTQPPQWLGADRKRLAANDRDD